MSNPKIEIGTHVLARPIVHEPHEGGWCVMRRSDTYVSGIVVGTFWDGEGVVVEYQGWKHPEHECTSTAATDGRGSYYPGQVITGPETVDADI